MVGTGSWGKVLEPSHFDLVHTRYVIRGEIGEIEPEQTSAALQVVHAVELPEAVLFEAPVEFYAEFR